MPWGDAGFVVSRSSVGTGGFCASTGVSCASAIAAIHASSAGANHHRFIVRLAPATEQPPFVPIPDEICEHLRLALLAFVDRNLHTAADEDMAPLAERHLHLRDHVPLVDG